MVSDNGLSSGLREAIIWTNYAEVFLIGPLGTNFSENLIDIRIFSFKKMRLKMSSGKCYIGTIEQESWRHITSHDNTNLFQECDGKWWLWVIKFNGLLWTANNKVHVIHISHDAMAKEEQIPEVTDKYHCYFQLTLTCKIVLKKDGYELDIIPRH